jgi:hypothetical protein
MKYQRKTADEFDVESNYGQGFEIVTCESTLKEARARRREYEANAGGVYRIVKRRVPIAPAA